MISDLVSTIKKKLNNKKNKYNLFGERAGQVDREKGLVSVHLETVIYLYYYKL